MNVKNMSESDERYKMGHFSSEDLKNWKEALLTTKISSLGGASEEKRKELQERVNGKLQEINDAQSFLDNKKVLWEDMWGVMRKEVEALIEEIAQFAEIPFEKENK